jgi:hypothetical protein
MIDLIMKNLRSGMLKDLFLFCFLLSLFVCFPVHTYSQETDFGTWLDANVSKKITKKLEIQADEEVRIFQNFSEINRFATSIGASYSFFKILKGETGYTWIYHHDVNDSYWDNRHRYYVQLIEKVNVGRLAFSLRERFQSTFQKIVKKSDYSPQNYLRSRLQVAWDIRNSKLEPYSSAEVIYQLNNPDGNVIDNLRYTLGTEFPLTKKLSMDTYLRISRDINVKHQGNLYLIGIDLNCKL